MPKKNRLIVPVLVIVEMHFAVVFGYDKVLKERKIVRTYSFTNFNVVIFFPVSIFTK